MLKKLTIRDFILIDRLDLDFNDGFSVFTGETGAGKSIFIDCISILIGERMNASMIRTGASKATIAGSFSVDEELSEILKQNGYDGTRLDVLREITSDGKSVTRVNDRNATLSFVRELFEERIDIHCQRDSQYLLKENNHIKLLDRYSRNESDLKALRQLFNEYKEVHRQYQNLLENEYNESQIEIIRYQVDEIEKAQLKEGEEEEISNAISSFNQREKIQNTMSQISDLFDGDNGIISNLYQFRHTSSQLESFSEIAEAVGRINDAYYALSDDYATINDYFAKMDFDTLNIDALNQRLFDIQRIKRKYNAAVPEVLKKCEEMKKQLDLVENRQDVLDELKKKMDSAYERFEQQAHKVHEIRETAAHSLEKEILVQLNDLNLEKAQFEVEITEASPSASGLDAVRFLISMNPGQPLRSLSNVASGGELSRLMLGMKTIFSRLQNSRLAIFDEIDTGVSGYVAFNMGLKMKQISSELQVFSVTHLAAVAAHADYHYRIEKIQSDSNTSTRLSLLDYQETIRELAVLSSSSISDASLAAAEELYRNARKEDNDDSK